MLTVTNTGNKSMTRNVSLFKKAPQGMTNDSDYDDVLPLVNDNVVEADVIADDGSNNNETTQIATHQSIDERRVSSRVRKDIDRFVARSASGLKGKKKA